MEKDIPELLVHLRDRYAKTVTAGQPVLGFANFKIDLSEYKLTLSDKTPVIWVRRADLESQPALNLIQSLNSTVTLAQLPDRAALVLLEGQKGPLLSYKPHFRIPYIFIDEAKQAEIMASRRPVGSLLDTIVDQLPISELSPYQDRGVVMGSRFFNRSQEIKPILSNPDTDYLIIGIRQIGKTSLMREAIRRLEIREGVEQGKGFFKYFDCSSYERNDEFIRDVVRWLQPHELTRLDRQDPNFFFPNFLERMGRKHHRRVTFFLDEIDRLVEIQHGSFELFDMLRSASQNGSCRFVMAGYRVALQETHRIDSPFYNFGKELPLGEFSRGQTAEMITLPMDNMRISLIDREAIVSRIFTETAGRPNLIQTYCQILIESLEQRNNREITVNDLFDIYSNFQLREMVVSSFLTNTHPVEQIIALSMVLAMQEDYSAGFGIEGVDDAVRRQGVTLSPAELDKGCRLLELAGIFRGRPDRGEIAFTAPIIARILNEHCHPLFVLRRAKEVYRNE